MSKRSRRNHSAAFTEWDPGLDQFDGPPDFHRFAPPSRRDP